jgi:DNA-binding NarL/FixJ family response regulator
MYSHLPFTRDSGTFPAQERDGTVIRVVIADDHPHVRSAIRHVLELEDDFEVVAEAEDGVEAVEAVGRTRPDLLVLDYRMPRLNGLQVARQLASVAPQTAMVMLTSEDDPRVRAEASRAGVSRYLLKAGRADDLLRTLRGVGSGRGDPVTVIVKPGAGEQESLPPPRIA